MRAGRVDAILGTWTGFLASYTDPLITYGLDWLRRFAPEQVSRISLLQGDTGPGNFVFDGDRLTAIVDFEWGHLGDPLEDLGNLCVREFWTPSGCLDGRCSPATRRQSGIPVDLATVRYYRVQQNVRGMIPIHAATRYAGAQEPLAWYLAYQYIGDRATCDAMAESMGITLTAPELPDEGEPGVLAQAVDHALAEEVLPAVDGAFARSRLADAQRMAACVDRLRRFERTIAGLELDALGELLGQRPETVADGMSAVDAGITARQLRRRRLLPTSRVGAVGWNGSTPRPARSTPTAIGQGWSRQASKGLSSTAGRGHWSDLQTLREPRTLDTRGTGWSSDLVR